MKKFTEPEVLINKSRLQEIYDLRVYAWENSPAASNVNKEKYPNGFYDKLDETSIHWVALNDNGKIIAAERLSIINNPDELPYPQILAHVNLPSQRPFLYPSRLVIDPDYRKLGLKEKFDTARLKHQVENKFAFSIAAISKWRLKELSKYGWQDCGEIPETTDYPFLLGKEHIILLPLSIGASIFRNLSCDVYEKIY